MPPKASPTPAVFEVWFADGAGHGIEVDGGNHLIPVDAKLERDTDVYDEALSLDRGLLAVEPAKKLRLVILDACRDNLFAKTMNRTVASRAIGQNFIFEVRRSYRCPYD